MATETIKNQSAIRLRFIKRWPVPPVWSTAFRRAFIETPRKENYPPKGGTPNHSQLTRNFCSLKYVGDHNVSGRAVEFRFGSQT